MNGVKVGRDSRVNTGPLRAMPAPPIVYRASAAAGDRSGKHDGQNRNRGRADTFFSSFSTLGHERIPHRPVRDDRERETATSATAHVTYHGTRRGSSATWLSANF